MTISAVFKGTNDKIHIKQIEKHWGEVEISPCQKTTQLQYAIDHFKVGKSRIYF